MGLNGNVRRRYAWQVGPKAKGHRSDGSPILTAFRGIPTWLLRTASEVEEFDSDVTATQP